MWNFVIPGSFASETAGSDSRSMFSSISSGVFMSPFYYAISDSSRILIATNSTSFNTIPRAPVFCV